jgi:hypothetical protein
MDIGLLNEKPLHAALKAWYAQPGDRLEVEVDGYFIDIVRGGTLIEVQTRNFSAIKRKVRDLTQRHELRLVYPIAREKWIVKLPQAGENASTRRKSPKRGRMIDIFREIVFFPGLLENPNFSLEILMIQEEELRRYDGKRGWRRRGWVTEERRLLDVLEQRLFGTPEDLWQLVPSGLPEEFTTSDLADRMGISMRVAQQVAYCSRKMGLIHQIGKRGNSKLYLQSSERNV